MTGLGAISPIGHNVQENWENLVAGKSGISEITLFDASALPAKIAGEVTSLNPTDYLPAKQVRQTDRFIQLCLIAGAEAIVDSGIVADESNAHRMGVYVGAGIGGVNWIENTTLAYHERGHRRVSPFYVPGSIINMAAGNLSIQHGFAGPNLAVSTACTTGTHAIGDAARFIEYGDADVMVAGGTEAAITPTSVAGFANAQALSRSNDEPSKASRPFDRERNGFVLGEGAGLLVLEELEFAIKRGAKIYAELTGFGMSGDAHHVTAPAPGGNGALRCMQNAIRNSKTDPSEFDYVNAHGTSTPLGDIAETKAIKQAFGDQAKHLAISGTKSMVGHLLGAAGGIEAVYTALAVHHQVAPPTINLDNPDPECDLDYVPKEARSMKIENAVSNSFGFGGTNGCIAFKRFH